MCLTLILERPSWQSVVPDKDDLSLEDVKSEIAGSLAKFKQPKAVVNVAELLAIPWARSRRIFSEKNTLT